jgi:hypothetical protein
MSDRTEESMDDDPRDLSLLALLEDQRPTPSAALERRVRHRVGVAQTRRAMRRYAVVCLTSGTLALVVAVCIAVTS